MIPAKSSAALFPLDFSWSAAQVVSKIRMRERESLSGLSETMNSQLKSECLSHFKTCFFFSPSFYLCKLAP